MLREIKQLLAGDPFRYKGGSITSLISDCKDQIDTLYKLTDEMQTLLPAIPDLGEFVRPSPMTTIEVLLNFAKEKCSE